MKHLYTLIFSILFSSIISAQSQGVNLADEKGVGTKKSGVILNTSNCENRTIGFSVSGIKENVDTYLWDFGNGVTSNLPNPSYVYSEAGEYVVTVVVSNFNGYSETLTKSLRIGKVPIPDFTASMVEGNYPFTVQFTNTTSGTVLTYLWNFGNYATSNVLDPNYVYANVTKDYDVTLTAISPDGCEASITKPAFIHVNGQTLYTLFVPNSFSPNGDGLNEIFMVEGENIRDVQLEIYDQTGRVVFTQNGQDPMYKGWNGTNLSNSPLPAGSYTYKIIATDVFDVAHKAMGVVNLMK